MVVALVTFRYWSQTGSLESIQQSLGDSASESIFPSQPSSKSESEYVVAFQRKLSSFDSFPFDFSVATLTGAKLRKSDFVGRVLIVDIWATWCPPCRAEIPSFVELQTKYRELGLSIVGVNYEQADSTKEAIASIRSFIAKQPINYPLALGNESIKNQIPDFRGFPTTLFIDGTGRVRMKLVGKHSTQVIEAYIALLLSELGSPAPVPPAARSSSLYSAFPSQTAPSSPVMLENPFVKARDE